MRTRKTPADGRAADPRAASIDAREQLFNGREVGPIAEVQLPTEAITSLHGILFDVDAPLFRADAPFPKPVATPKQFCKNALVPWLERDPALAGAEVRDTGRGLHALLWFDEPVKFASDGERKRWAGIVQVVQAALPVDPDQPGITALTRPVGTANAKTGRAVKRLREGAPVPVADVLRLYDRLARSPFGTVATILFGTERVSPCPVCRVDGTTLSATDVVGHCYGACGHVRLERLYDAFLVAREPAPKGADHGGR